MKFSTSILTLLAASSAYSISLDGRPKPNISEFDEGNDVESAENADSIDASAAVKCYSYIQDCIPMEKDSYSSENIDGICSGFTSESCQSFFEDPVSIIDGCDKLPFFKENDEKNYYLDYLTDIHAHTKLYCQKNENGDYCPLNNLNTFRGAQPSSYHLINEVPSNEDLQKAIEETCKSKYCYDAALEYFNSVSSSTNTTDATKLKELSQFALDLLNADSCKEQADASAAANQSNRSVDTQSNRSVDSSGATAAHSIKYGLLAAFGFILATLFN